MYLQVLSWLQSFVPQLIQLNHNVERCRRRYFVNWLSTPFFNVFVCQRKLATKQKPSTKKKKTPTNELVICGPLKILHNTNYYGYFFPISSHLISGKKCHAVEVTYHQQEEDGYWNGGWVDPTPQKGKQGSHRDNHRVEEASNEKDKKVSLE